MSHALPFAKMHGLTNDYVVVGDGVLDPAAAGVLAPVLCARRTGIGADGLLLVTASTMADFRMRMFNVDGSEAEMCGNGLRCATRFALAAGQLQGAGPWTAETGAGVLGVSTDDEGRTVTVDMGVARVGEAASIEIDGETVSYVPADMGNPHAVVFVPDVEAAAVATLGPRIETHPAFPDRTNVEFVEVVSRRSLRQRTWERGCGETFACGTGACAVAAVAAALGHTDPDVSISMRGGVLEVAVSPTGEVRMRGPAVHVHDGVWPHAAQAAS